MLEDKKINPSIEDKAISEDDLDEVAGGKREPNITFMDALNKTNNSR